MKFPSIHHIIEQTRRTTNRFPLVLTAAIIGGTASIYMIELRFSSTPGYIIKSMMVAALGIPLLFAFRLIAERRSLTGAIALLWQSPGVILLALYFITLPKNISRAPNLHFYRFFILLLATHLLVAFAPYLQKNQLNEFWHFNKCLFLRFLVAALFSGVLYVGLSVALLSIEQLFGVKIPGKRYGQLFLFIAWIFNTYVFLSGVPRDFTGGDKSIEYPKGLKVFSQYVLIPIVLIYLVILYAYQIKILFEWNLPKGWTANLVLGFSIVGIFAYLLIYPIRNRPENKWLRFFSRWYFAALIPPVIMLHLAIWRRISDYGITVNRYVVLALAVWLTVMVLYFVVVRERNIKLIPITLFLVAMIAALGPANAFSFSEKSQVKRLRNYLERNHLLVEGQIHPASSPLSVPLADRGEISSIIRYLHDMHGLQAIYPWFVRNLQGVEKDSTAHPRQNLTSDKVFQLLGFPFTYSGRERTPRRHEFKASSFQPVLIEGYEYYFMVNRYYPLQETQTFSTGTETFYLNFKDDHLLQFSEENSPDQLRLDLKPFARELVKSHSSSRYQMSMPPEEMILSGETTRWRVKLFFSDLTVYYSPDSIKVVGFNLLLFIGKK